MLSDNPPKTATQTLLNEVERLRLENDELNAEVLQLKEDLAIFEAARDHYTELYDFISVGSVTLNLSGTITDANRRTHSLLGFERRRLLGKPMLSLVDRKYRHRFLEHLVACRNGSEAVTFYVVIKPSEGEAVPVRLTLRCAHDKTSYALALLDLRELETAHAEQERLSIAEREARADNDTKSRLLSSLSNELRGLLWSVMRAGADVETRPDVPDELRSPLGSLLQTITVLRSRVMRLTAPRLRSRGATLGPHTARQLKRGPEPRMRATK